MKTGVCPGDNRTMYVVVWDNVSFHHSAVVRQWFAAHDRMLMEFLPPYTPFLNPIEEFFSSWRWKVYDRHPHTQMALLAAMDAACDDITAESCRGWIRHSRRYFPRCIDRADIPCDVDENMWADRRERLDIND
uniref:DDE superfamily endonuclease n=1 Tax=Nothobranchius kadleci TaxID=1051664 RepID=A0A1A8BRY8_NOTKA